MQNASLLEGLLRRSANRTYIHIAVDGLSGAIDFINER